MNRPAALAVLGDPLAFTLSPVLHRAGCAALGITATSEALPTSREALGVRLDELAARGVLGVNLTAPLKEAALDHLDRISEGSALSRSVNTIGFGPDGWWGDTTDGPGLVDLLGSLGRNVARERALLLGAGGAARSLALALVSAGASGVAASARRPAEAAAAWKEIAGARVLTWGSGEEQRALKDASLVINATPLTDESVLPRAQIPARALVLDLIYGPQPTPWVRAARARGIEAYDGLGLLVFQARRSLALWFGRPLDVDPLARAVGWPR